jgi:hypothetical protein
MPVFSPILLWIALSTTDSFGISLIPASHNGRAICAIDVQTYIAIPPSAHARRILMSDRMKDRREAAK